MDAQGVIGKVHERYKARMIALIRLISAEFVEDGWVLLGDIHDHTDMTYAYRQIMRHPKRSDPKVGAPAGIIVEIVEAVQCDGAPADGINFRVDIGDEQGHQIDFQPHNFTPGVWVHARNAKAVEARFRVIEGFDYSNIARELYR